MTGSGWNSESCGNACFVIAISVGPLDSTVRVTCLVHIKRWHKTTS